jgi:hypothetical protein
VTHLDDGALRRLVDDPYAVPEAARAHHASCAACQARYAAAASDAHAAARLLVGPVLDIDSSRALGQARARIAAATASSSPWPSWLEAAKTLASGASRRAVATVIGAVLVVFILATTGVAETILQIFEPRRFVAVPVSSAELAALPDLSSYGDMSVSRPGTSRVADAQAAAAAADMKVLVPSSLPAGVADSARYSVTGAGTMTFTFRAERARETAALRGATAPPMPANIDGSRLYVTTHPVVETTYGSVDASGGTLPDVPTLMIVQTKAPTVSSSGVTVRELLDYLLAQPQISPRVAAQIRAIRDPESTLPIPVAVDQAFSKNVFVQGVPGLFIGDSTGLGSGVLWQKNGIIYGVGGSLTEEQVLAVANSLR